MEKLVVIPGRKRMKNVLVFDSLEEADTADKLLDNFGDWHPVHFETVDYILNTTGVEPSMANLVQEEYGHGGLWELAKPLADTFVLKYSGRGWDGDFTDTLESFLDEENRIFDLDIFQY